MLVKALQPLNTMSPISVIPDRMVTVRIIELIFSNPPVIVPLPLIVIAPLAVSRT